MFNSEQREYMRELAATPPEKLCYCGWYPAGRCNAATKCPPHLTAADKLRDQAAAKTNPQQ